ncbi:MAG: PstS family phosphate ABC transporter substrate-binding protein [Nitrososphaerota archaeon]
MMANPKMVGLILTFLLVGGVVGYITGWYIAGSSMTGRGLTVTETRFVGEGAKTSTITERVTVTVHGLTQTTGPLAGDILIDGSSTVYPITEAVAEAFMKTYPAVKISVGISGTGGGFKRFIMGETDINDASRPILMSEAQTAEANGIRWIEIPVAIDGLVIVVNRENDWVECLTFSELKKIWEPESTVTKWSDIREGWPDEPIRLYGPGPDSGTFDYFTERVIGKLKASRTDYIASEDDNVLVAGVEGERYALGYFGYAYYPYAADKIKIVAVRDDSIPDASCVTPTDETVSSYKYPLSRPLFLYVNKRSWDEKPWLREFVYFYLENGERFVKQVSYTPLPSNYYKMAVATLKAGITDGLYSLSQISMWKNAGPH